MKELSNSEKIVMACVYKHIANTNEKPNVHDINELLLNTYGIEWKLQTLCTFLKRIENKGYITSERIKRFSYYTPVMEYDSYIKAELQNMANIYFDGNVKEIVKHIIVY